MTPNKKGGRSDSAKTFSKPKKTTASSSGMVPADYSDAKYILVLFILGLIVVIFGILVYIFSQTPTGPISPTTGRQQTFEEALAQAEGRGQQAMDEETQDDIARIEERVANTQPTENTTPTETQVNTTTTTTQNRTFTIPADFDASRYNPRSEDTRTLYGRSLIQSYFSLINDGEYTEACSLTSLSICNARRDIFAFENFLSQLKGGYTLENIYEATEQKDDEKIYCVQYSYQLKEDLNQTPITELFQYRIKMRPDGADEISARVCEKVMKNGRVRPCPIETPKKYCDI